MTMAVNVDKLLSLSLVLLLNLEVFLCTETSDDYLRREHSLQKSYSGPYWDFRGSTMITNNYVRLTPDRQSQRGSIWNTIPVTARDWEIHVHFKVHGSGTELFGDGFAFWYTKEHLESGTVFGSKDHFSGLAIFFDTYANQNGPHNHIHPYISAMVNDGTLSYDHDRDGTHTEVAGCEAQFRGAAHDTYAAIRYSKDTLKVSVDIDGTSSWKECFSVEGIKLPTGYFMGLSAATGALADNHDIISVKFYELSVEHDKNEEDYSKISPSASFFAPPRDHVDDPKGAFMLSRLSGWRLFIIILLLVVGLGVCAMVGFVIFQKKQENARKRFY